VFHFWCPGTRPSPGPTHKNTVKSSLPVGPSGRQIHFEHVLSALDPSKSGLMNKHIVKHIVNSFIARETDSIFCAVQSGLCVRRSEGRDDLSLLNVCALAIPLPTEGHGELVLFHVCLESLVCRGLGFRV
jgi:hypothetical protein